MGKTGQSKTGESLTGDLIVLTLNAPVQTWQLDSPTASVSGTGTASLSSPVQVWQWVLTTDGNPSKTGERKPGERPTGGQPGMQATIEPLTASLSAPTQTWQLDSPTASVSGTGTASLSSPVQVWNFISSKSDIGTLIGTTTWDIDGNAIGQVSDETATHDSLSFTTRVETSTLTSVLRDLKTDEGQLDVLVTDSGGYTTVDRSDSASNTFSLDPPVDRRPLRQIGDYLVAAYEEDLVSQAVDEFDVTLEFVPDANRTDSQSISQTRASDEWSFNTRYGTIATDRVDAEFLGTGADGVERFELVMRLTFKQALSWEAALSKVEGVRIQEIPDASNKALDDTSGDNTVTIDPPDGDTVVSNTDYVVLSWQSERLNDGYQRVTAEIAVKG